MAIRWQSAACVVLAAAAARGAVVTSELHGGSSALSTAVSRASVAVSSSSRAPATRVRGSGLLLGHGLVLTSADAVMLRAATGEAVPLDAIEVSGGGVRARASLLVVIDGAGLALLHAEGFADAPPVRMGDSSALEAGAPVYVASEPGERDHLASGVVIGEVDRELSNASLRYVETTLAAPPSSSGAPVFDDQGEVVGIAAGNGSEGLVFLRVEDVKRVLRPLESAR